ncbi:hypothetical protein D5086_031434 [Populus alba]|uniref:Uncharacterized protein n=1 Tax=Populus alba TaxID=43335 RepID=A0ACC4AIJ7_POPAL
MAMIAVQVVLEKLASFVAEETRFLGGVRGGIVELQDDLYSMKSFLQDAEERSESDQGLRAWVKQVRDVAYDAEDILEEFMLRFAPSPGSGFTHYLRNSYRSIRNWKIDELQKLGSVEVNEDYELVRELGKLTSLRRLGILKLREEQGMDLCYTLDRLKHLTALYLVSLNKTESLQFDSLSSPPKYLQRLYLKCSLPALPGWIASLQYISKLVLQYSNLKSDPLKALQKLPSLVVLELRQAYAGEELCCDPSGFSKLKKLGLHELDRLRRIRIAEGSMPGLERLDITACTVLETVPDGIENLKNIEDLVLWSMPSTFIKTIERYRGEDFRRVKHITTITCD